MNQNVLLRGLQFSLVPDFQILVSQLSEVKCLKLAFFFNYCETIEVNCSWRLLPQLACQLKLMVMGWIGRLVQTGQGNVKKMSESPNNKIQS